MLAVTAVNNVDFKIHISNDTFKYFDWLLTNDIYDAVF
jgi:hypothetical protein